MKKGLLILSVSASLMFSSCVTMFMPKKQKVTIETGQTESTTYVQNEEFGKGKTVTDKIKKEGSKQIVVKTPGYKNTYAALVPTHRPFAFYPLALLNVFNTGYGLMFDMMAPKNMSYDKIVTVPVTGKLINRATTDKNVEISNVRLNIKKTDKDLAYFNLKHTSQPEKEMKAAEAKKDTQDKKEAEKLAKAKAKKKKKGTLEPADNEIKYDDTKFTENVYETLKKTGFIDTVNKIFYDQSNTIVLEGSIDKIYNYSFHTKKYSGSYKRAKIFLTWYIKNSFNEILDSIKTNELSGEFTYGYSYAPGTTYNYSDAMASYSKSYEKMIGDAIDISYLKLHQNSTFKKYLKQEASLNFTESKLSLSAPKSFVGAKEDAAEASVIVKSKDGHGSGFAISNDGYIITNYHVIAGKYAGKPREVTILTSTGEELTAKVVRYNKFRDVALLKVEKQFAKAFQVKSEKSFKNLQEVFTVGAPKSIELGQSISVGVISNERQVNNNHLLQLGMSINGGNSGGPLFDAAGKLHGVIVSKLVGKNTEGVGFAVPGFLLKEYLNLEIK